MRFKCIFPGSTRCWKSITQAHGPWWALASWRKLSPGFPDLPRLPFTARGTYSLRHRGYTQSGNSRTSAFGKRNAKHPKSTRWPPTLCLPYDACFRMCLNMCIWIVLPDGSRAVFIEDLSTKKEKRIVKESPDKYILYIMPNRQWMQWAISTNYRNTLW